MNPAYAFSSQSILGRLGIGMGLIVIFAIASIMISTIFTEMSAGQGRAINIAGSLRMHSYLLSSQLTRPGQSDAERAALIRESVAQYERRLRNPLLLGGLRIELNHPLRDTYGRIVRDWEEYYRPLVLAAATSAEKRAQFVATVPRFVEDIDRLVKLLEQELEDKIQWLRLVQGISLFLIVVIVLVTMYMMHTQVLLPLKNLLDCARAVREGNFAVTAEHTGPDELGELGQAFNTMVHDLSQMYANLETRVRQKTEELARSNRSLELLYGTIRTLSEQQITPETLNQVLREVERAVELPRGAICAASPDQQHGFPLAGEIGVRGIPEICGRLSCGDCLAGARTPLAIAEKEGQRIVSIPLSDGGKLYGVMPLEVPPGTQLEPWKIQLLEAAGRHIGAALATAQRTEERHRLALFEERSVIARELHDSLAQSLSYLKIQVVRLQSLLPAEVRNPQTEEVLGGLKNGLNNAYRQLRELLTTFRLRIDGRGLLAALEDTVHEFRRRGGFAIELNNRLLGVELASNEEIHVLQVIREALSNVEHHARASRVEVSLEHLPGNRVRVRVDDDGIGIRDAAAPTHHFGLVIMRDRARSLHGALEVSRLGARGTRVELEFEPATPFRELAGAPEQAGA